MADYIMIRKGRNIVSSVLHVLLNVLLGVGSIFVTVVTGNWITGIVLVLISKWRVFAVRPRYWFLNIRSSLVDFIVGSSLVMLAYYAGSELTWAHLLLSIIYVVWLLFIKTRTSANWVLAQAICAVFLGSAATAIITSGTDSALIVLMEFIIGYGASRHILAQSSDKDFSLLTLVCGLLAAEISWLCHSWMIIYTYGSSNIFIPQISIILSILTFLFSRFYNSSVKNDGKIKFSDVRGAAIFSIIVIIVVVVGFSTPRFNIF